MGVQYFIDNFHFVNPIMALVVPVVLMLIDFATGFVNACIKGERSSSKMRQGGGKKFAEFICIMVAQLLVWGMGLPEGIANLVPLYIVFMELVSIVENVKKLGVPAPSQVDELIGDLKDEIFDDDHPPDEEK